MRKTRFLSPNYLLLNSWYENNNSRGPSQSAESSDKSQECEGTININLPTINTVRSVNTNITPVRENNGMGISTNNCISDSPNNSSLTGNCVQLGADVLVADSLSQPKPKNLVSCPFLRRRGYCLKGQRCDFLHNDTQSSTSSVQSQSRKNPISTYPFSYAPRPNSGQNPLSFEPTFFPPMRIPGFSPRITLSHPLFSTPLYLHPSYRYRTLLHWCRYILPWLKIFICLGCCKRMSVLLFLKLMN